MRPVTTAAGTSVRGLGFAHYASNQDPAKGSSGQFIINADNVTFENNTVAWGASTGVQIFSPQAVVRGITSVYNGMNGMGGNRAVGALVEGNRIARRTRRTS